MLRSSCAATGLLAVAAALVLALPAGGGRSTGQPSGLIAFTRGDGVYVVREDGSGVRALRRGGVAAHVLRLAWSPDGRKLAFSDTAGRGIWVMDADGTDLVRLVSLRRPLRSLGPPTWSPDGRRLAFTANRDVDESYRDRDLWVVNRDGSGLRRLTARPVVVGLGLAVADWSTGGRIALTENTWAPGVWESDMYVMNADGSGLRNLTPDPEYASADFPDWSPDGRRIAYTFAIIPWSRPHLGSLEPRDQEIWVLDADGRSRVQLTRNHVPDFGPAWSPDGRKIAFVRWTHSTEGLLGRVCRGWGVPAASCGFNEIYVMNADGTGVRRLTHTPGPPKGVGYVNPAWQPVAS